LFLFLQKTLSTFFGLDLLVPLFVLSTGSLLQAHGQTTSVHESLNELNAACHLLM
jgi:hypothetical protein